MTSAASLLSSPQSLQQDAGVYERVETSSAGALSAAARGAAMIAVDRVVTLAIGERADNLAGSSDGSLKIDHDPSRISTGVDGSTPESQLDDRDELRLRMSDEARAAVAAAHAEMPDTQV